MYCSNCGKEVSEQAAVCLGCGAEIRHRNTGIDNAPASAFWWWLGFLVPVVGLLLWCLCSDTMPQKAKKAGKGAIVSLIVDVALIVLLGLLHLVGIGAIFFLALR